MTFRGFIRSRQQVAGILGLLLIVLSLTGLLGCPLPNPPAKSATAITGTLSYGENNTINATSGISKTQTPNWTGETSGQTVTYSIAPAKNGISINASTGVVSIADTAPTISSGTYTVTAKGTGDFGGDDITATIGVAIQKKEATAIIGTLSYGDNNKINATFGTEKIEKPLWSSPFDATQKVTYAITPAKEGISINKGSGQVIVANTVPVSSGTYTVTASGYDTYTGSRTADITITIVEKSITGTGRLRLTYPNIDVTFGAGKTQAPVWTGHDYDSDQTVTYIITDNGGKSTEAKGISINEDSGDVTVADTAPVSSGTYTVTATGKGNFTGKITGTIPITIAGKSIGGTLTYTSIDVVFGTEKIQGPTWTERKDTDQTVTYMLTDNGGNSTEAKGISINEDSGVVTVSNTASASSGTYTVTASGYGDYIDSRTAEITITIAKKTIMATLTYDDMTATVGIGKIQSPEWTGHRSDPTNVDYSISPLVQGINMNPYGMVLVDSSALRTSSGDYTVTATGKGNFTGKITGTIKITIQAPRTITGTLSYADLTTGFGRSKRVEPEWITDSPDQLTSGNMIYSIAPSGTGIHIDIFTGTVSTYSDTPATSSGTYTITAKGSGIFGGDTIITADITITIQTPRTITGTFTYADLKIEFGNSKHVKPEWITDSPDQLTSGNMIYSIAPSGTGIHIDIDTGMVSTYSDTPATSSGTYTVTATGQKDYKDSITADITITIAQKSLTGRFSYDPITVAAGTPGLSFYPRWEWDEDEEKDLRIFNDGNIEYSIAPPSGNDGTGVTISEHDGVVSFDSTATAASAGVYTVTATGIGSFTGKITSTITIIVNASAIPLSGEFSYDHIMTVAGSLERYYYNPKWVIPNESEGEQNPHVIFAQYSITPPPGNAGKGVQIAKNSGEIYVDSTATVESSGVYTVTATGVNKFEGTITADVKITVNAEVISITGELKYEKGLTAVAGGTPKGEAPTWTGIENDDQKNSGSITYTITPPLVNLGDRVVIVEPNTGKVHVQAHATRVENVGEYVYTVTATGKGAFTGKRTATIKITLTEPKPLAGSFSYGEEGVITVTTDTKTSFPPNWIGHDTDQLEPLNIDYKIEPSSRFFSSGTGNLELEGIRVEDSGTYTVTATGTHDFQGTKTASVTITVTEP